MYSYVGKDILFCLYSSSITVLWKNRWKINKGGRQILIMHNEFMANTYASIFFSSDLCENEVFEITLFKLLKWISNSSCDEYHHGTQQRT